MLVAHGHGVSIGVLTVSSSNMIHLDTTATAMQPQRTHFPHGQYANDAWQLRHLPHVVEVSGTLGVGGLAPGLEAGAPLERLPRLGDALWGLGDGMEVVHAASQFFRSQQSEQ